MLDTYIRDPESRFNKIEIHVKDSKLVNDMMLQINQR